MPVIVVGADTEQGRAITERLHRPEREVRAFVSDEKTATELKGLGVKVALGDVSDESHVEAASLRCFSAILIATAAEDGRERAFAETIEEVLEGWARAVSGSRVHRVIWVSGHEPPPVRIREVATVAPSDPGLIDKVLALDDAQEMSTSPDI